MILLGMISTGLGSCFAVLALEDARHFEIKLEVLPILLGFSLALALVMPVALWDVAIGSLIWGGIALTARGLTKAGFGLGDIWLFGAAGAFFGVSDGIFGALGFALSAVFVSAIYSTRRGKRFGRTLFPAALPMSLAMLAVMEWRLFEAVSGSEVSVFGALALLSMPIIGALGGALAYLLLSSQEEVVVT